MKSRRKPIGSKPGLSELEGCVLGVVWERGPCTAYVVRGVFLASPSPFWSGSAGAIYPLLARLEERRLLRSRASATGRRRSRLYSLAPAGLDALRAWMGPPLPDWAVGVPVDPLRTRVSFLGSLPPARQGAFVAEVRRKLDDHIQLVRADCRRRRAEGSCFERLVARGALRMLLARRAWLREVRSEVIRAAGGRGGRDRRLSAPRRRTSSGSPAPGREGSAPPSFRAP